MPELITTISYISGGHNDWQKEIINQVDNVIVD